MNKSVKTVLITTWGNPWKSYSPTKYRWDVVEYVIKTYEEVRIKSRTTLPLIQKAYGCNKAVVLVQESVLFNNEVNNYEDVEKNVKNVFNEFVEELKRESQVELGEVKIHVMPSIGKFKNEFRDGEDLALEICGSLTDYYRMVYYVIAKELIDHDESPIVREDSDNEIHIILDLTHGINYTPVLTYEAVKYIAGLLAWFTNVRLTVLNSEPITTSSSEYNIHVVEDREVPSTTEIYGLYEDKKKILTTNKRCVGESKDAIGRDLSNKLSKLSKELSKDDLNAFLGSFANGVPLSTVLLQPDPAALQKGLEEIVGLYKYYTQVRKTNEYRVSISHDAMLKGDFLGIVSAWILAKMMKSIGFPRKNYMLLNEIKKLNDKVFNKNKKFSALINKDIRELQERLEGKVGSKVLFRIFEDTVGACVDELVNQDKFKRDFLAHSGFERCVTMFENCENDFAISYLYFMKPLNKVDSELDELLNKVLNKELIKKGKSTESYVLELIKKTLATDLIYMNEQGKRNIRTD